MNGTNTGQSSTYRGIILIVTYNIVSKQKKKSLKMQTCMAYMICSCWLMETRTVKAFKLPPQKLSHFVLPLFMTHKPVLTWV